MHSDRKQQGGAVPGLLIGAAVIAGVGSCIYNINIDEQENQEAFRAHDAAEQAILDTGQAIFQEVTSQDPSFDMEGLFGKSVALSPVANQAIAEYLVTPDAHAARKRLIEECAEVNRTKDQVFEEIGYRKECDPVWPWALRQCASSANELAKTLEFIDSNCNRPNFDAAKWGTELGYKLFMLHNQF